MNDRLCGHEVEQIFNKLGALRVHLLLSNLHMKLLEKSAVGSAYKRREKSSIAVALRQWFRRVLTQAFPETAGSYAGR
jgi:hypothetical protein